MRAIVVAYLLIIVTMVVGWVMNLVQVVHMGTEAITGLFILKCVGVIVPPVGAVLGYLG